MAERRMFAKSIVLSDAFLDMPMSARCLYFTLGMLADDDGFIGNPKSIMRQCGASQDDMLVLLQKRYVLSFDSGVIVIKHWRMNNYLQSDRHKATNYIEEKATLTIDEKGAYTELKNDMYTECIQTVYTGKDSIGKDKEKSVINNTLKESRIEDAQSADADPEESKSEPVDYQLIVDKYNDVCKSLPRVTRLSDKRRKAIRARLRKYGLDDIVTCFKKAEASDFLKGANNRNWSADFDWLMCDSNMAKVLDGKYDGARGQPVSKSSGQQNRFNDFNQRRYDFAALEKEMGG